MRDLSVVIGQMLELVPEDHEVHYCLKSTQTTLRKRDAAINDWNNIADCLTACFGERVTSRMPEWQRDVMKIWNPYMAE